MTLSSSDFFRLIAYLDLKIDGLNKDLEHIAGGVLDDRDAAAAGLPCD